MPRIGVIGAGATGVLLACNLRRTLPDARVLLVEKRTQLGRGVAYSTRDPGHLLNVRVSNMSAFPDDPDHFFRWLQLHGPRLGTGRPTHFCFVPRRVYGAYLAGLIDSPSQPSSVDVVNAECVDAVEHPGGVRLVFDSGDAADVDICILATGSHLRASTSPDAIGPWEPGAFAGLRGGHVLILGTGLSMVDAVITLHRGGYNGLITAISRRGLRPATHRAVEKRPIEPARVPFGAPVSRLLRWVRHEVDARGDGDWRSIIDAIRPHTAAIWAAMDIDARRRFLRHARPWWDAHRHRMAPAISETVDNLVAEGRLRLIAGRVLSTERRAASIGVAYRRRGSAAVEVEDVARMFDCSGLPDDPLLATGALIGALLARGQVRPDPLRLGLDVDEHCALLDTGGRPSSRLFAAGPISRARFWEMVAIPDIRVQCAALATRIAGSDHMKAMRPVAPELGHQTGLPVEIRLHG